MKNILPIIIALAIGIGIGYWVLPAPVVVAPEQETPEVIEEENTMCAQVITPAINPETGRIEEFGTPCDVPEGWEVVRNEIPGLESY